MTPSLTQHGDGASKTRGRAAKPHSYMLADMLVDGHSVFETDGDLLKYFGETFGVYPL